MGGVMTGGEVSSSASNPRSQSLAMMSMSHPMPTSQRILSRSLTDPQLPREHSENNKALNPRKYQRPKEMCHETAYGDCYTSMMGHNPYMRVGLPLVTVRD